MYLAWRYRFQAFRTGHAGFVFQFAHFPLSNNVEHLKDRIRRKTLIIAEKESFGDQWGENCIDTPLTKSAIEAGSIGFSNIMALVTYSHSKYPQPSNS